MLSPKNLVLAGLLLLCAVAVAAEKDRNLSVARTEGAQRIALVIGNGAYPGVAALKNPVNDALDVAGKLKTFGFKVTVKTNVSLREMLRTLTTFGDSIHPGGEVVFYYAGHGMQVRGRNYLIPVDAEIRTESAVSSEAVDVEQLLDKLASARLSLVILDACRNNPFEQRFRGGGQGLASINAPTGTMIAYSTAPGKVASDGDGRNGLYTQELLAAMSVPGIKVEDVFKRVRTNVVRKSGEAQVPWESSSLTGDFYFRPGDLAGVPPPGVSEHASPELAFWNSAERGNSVGDYEAYLKRFPNGAFEDLAKTRIAMLKQLQSPAEVSGDRTVEAPPRFHVGDSWRYSKFSQVVEQASDEGFVLKLAAGSTNTTTRTNREGNPIATETVTGVGTVTTTYSPFMPVLRFPLKPGKTWREQYRMSTSFMVSTNTDSEYEAKVVGWEIVKVPAGSFEALRIDWRVRGSGIAAVNQDGSHWYAPAVKGLVKSVTRVRGESAEAELDSYSVQPD